jgi:hypothetical protein
MSFLVASSIKQMYSCAQFAYCVLASNTFSVMPIWVQNSCTSHFIWAGWGSQTRTSGATMSFANCFNDKKYHSQLASSQGSTLQTLCWTQIAGHICYHKSFLHCRSRRVYRRRSNFWSSNITLLDPLYWHFSKETSLGHGADFVSLLWGSEQHCHVERITPLLSAMH